MIDITKSLIFEDTVEKTGNSFGQSAKCTTIARGKTPLFMHSCTIVTNGYYYFSSSYNGESTVRKKGFAGTILIYALFEDDTRQNIGLAHIEGESDGYSSVPMLQETHTIPFTIPEEQKKKKIKELSFIYYKFSKVSDHIEDYQSTKEAGIAVVSIKVYSNTAGKDSGLRVMSANGRILKVLETAEPSSLRFFYQRTRNIMIVPLDHALASSLRIRTASGIMSIAVEK